MEPLNKDTTEPCKSVLISEVFLIQRFPYNSCNIMLYNSGPWTLVHIVEVSVIGAVHFRRFHCILIPSRNLLIIANWFLCYFFLQLHSLVDPVSAMGEWCAWSRLTHVTGRFSINSVCMYMQEKMLSCLKTRSLVPPYPNPCIKCMVRTSQLTV